MGTQMSKQWLRAECAAPSSPPVAMASLCLLCTDSGVGLGIKGCSGDLSGVLGVKASGWHTRHRRTNGKKYYLSPVLGCSAL